MARETLANHWKLARLTRYLDSRILARGSLELLWEAGYASGDPQVGSAVDIEDRLGWKGEPGALTAALARSGFLDPSGFDPDSIAPDLPEHERRLAIEKVRLEAVETVLAEDGQWEIHDLMDHAPNMVRRRMVKELERKQKGLSLRQIRSAAGRAGAVSRWQTDGKRMAPDGSELHSPHSTLHTPHSAPHTQKPSRARAREKSPEVKQPEAPPLILTGEQDPPKAADQSKALDFWRESVWPSISTAPCPKPTKEAMVNLARRCREQGLPSVIDAMQRFNAAMRAGKVKREFTSLLWFATRGFEQWLPPSPASSDRNPFRAGGAE